MLGRAEGPCCCSSAFQSRLNNIQEHAVGKGTSISTATAHTLTRTAEDSKAIKRCCFNKGGRAARSRVQLSHFFISLRMPASNCAS